MQSSVLYAVPTSIDS